MLLNILIKPLLAGLSVGAFCMSYCFPFLATFISSEHRTNKRNLILIIYFMLGRLFGYVIFGFIFGYVGQQLHSLHLTLITNLSLIFLSIILILHITGLYKQKDNLCLAPKFQSRNAAVMGFFMGVNLCPPFLLSLSYVVSLHDILQSVIYFIIFFLSSSIYFLPMIFVGMLARMKELQKAARVSGLMAAFIFIVYGTYSIVKIFLR